MPKRIYVGNLPFSASYDELLKLFSKVGDVRRVSLVTDRETGRPRGYGFIEMKEEADIQKAIKTLDESMFNGQKLEVKLE